MNNFRFDEMNPRSNKIKRLKKYHKWPGLIIAFILLYYAITGILMNHRELISGFNITRSLLPNNYSYVNWNQAALKGSIELSKDSTLFYGNIGIWLTDSTYSNFVDFNIGFPEGMDNRKIFDIHLTDNHHLYAATLFGLYNFNFEKNHWQKIKIDVDIERFVAVTSKNDTVVAMNRSYVFKGLDTGYRTKFEKIEIKAPKGYNNKVGLFETMWLIHSGEIFGLPGQLFVDFLGILIIILSLSGITYFFFPQVIKRRKRKEKKVSLFVATQKFALVWHNKIGAWFLVFFILLALTGTFLRPPLLIPIANTRIPAIKFTHLDQPNPWYDDLRDILYDKEKNLFVLAGYNGLYELKTLTSVPSSYQSQPPVSVMGINVLEKYNEQYYFIGSFSGLFLWHPNKDFTFDFISGKPYQGLSNGRPFGSYAITGIIKSKDLYIIDYDKGVLAHSNSHPFPKMSENIIENTPMSLWNFALEVHTGRIFSFLLSDFYILIVPLTGIFTIIVLISGYLIWRRRKRRN
ncbi:MAG: iron-regulated protein [Marinilabiliales bacterium]|nr:MAG: iron-regulated protein [Marinilabiliales bacterium]